MGIMFATFTSPLLNSFFVVFIYFTGHLSRSLYIYSGNVKDIIIKKILLIIYYIFPNLELLNFRVEALYSYSIPSSDIFSGILTFLSWTITAFLAGVLIFENKKLI
ncbi:MAG: hypothetical protein CSA18_03890 [Deltaproteobacteria bacterium]|nr:MAG: hypothetical protein CSB21_00480 [Deltaproteobacteria bacterium]PIE74700.1 MAG: hypothetical protein CSA18_03890 [Deltaproteobacteria bacterium]